MKKNKCACFFLILNFVVFVSFVQADDCEAVLFQKDNSLFLRIEYRFESVSELLEPIEAGLKAQIFYHVQLYEKRQGFFSFLGDILLAEMKLEHTGFKDFFENVFIIEDEQGSTRTWPAEDKFLNAFFRRDLVPLDDLLRGNRAESRYLRVQVQLFKVKLIAPLTLIYFFTSQGVYTSDWKTVPLP